MQPPPTHWQIALIGLLSSVLFLGGQARAAKAPGDPREMREWASHVVLATVQDIGFEAVPTAWDPGWGTSDWKISVRLEVEEVEKGEGIEVGEEVVAVAYHPRTRRAMLESLAPGRHWPIPAKGERVRAYLQREKGQYQVYLPNGFAPPGEYPDEELSQRQGAMPTSGEAEALWTWWWFGMPVELWGLVALLGLPVVAVAGWLLTRGVWGDAGVPLDDRGPRGPRRLRILVIAVAVWTLLLCAGFVVSLDIFHEYGAPILFAAACVLTGYALLAWRMCFRAGARPSLRVTMGLTLVGVLAGFFLAERLTPAEHFLLVGNGQERLLRLIRSLVLPYTTALMAWMLACLLGAFTSRTEEARS
jgi:hypothetical protein